MKSIVAISSLVCLLFASHSFSADKDALQGTWGAGQIEVKGKKIDTLGPNVAEFEGDELTLYLGGRDVTNKYKIDDSKSPKHIDIAGKEAQTKDGKDSYTLGIYKIEGDTLTLCIAGGRAESNKTTGAVIHIADPRPTDFDSEQGALMVFKLTKPPGSSESKRETPKE